MNIVQKLWVPFSRKHYNNYNMSKHSISSLVYKKPVKLCKDIDISKFCISSEPSALIKVCLWSKVRVDDLLRV